MYALELRVGLDITEQKHTDKLFSVSDAVIYDGFELNSSITIVQYLTCCVSHWLSNPL